MITNLFSNRKKSIVDEHNQMKSGVMIVDYPYPAKVRKSYKFTSNFLMILQFVVDKIVVISDNVNEENLDTKKIKIQRIGIAPHFLNEISNRWISLLLWILKSIIIQIKICIEILRASKDTKVVIFFMMYPYTELLPMLIAKLLRKITIKVPLGIAPRDRIYAPLVYDLFERMSLYLADFHIPEYESTVEWLRKSGKLKYPEKLLPAMHFLILEDYFRNTKSLHERENVVGYIGGFREIKGIINFVKAIPFILNEDKTVRFLIAGDGILKEQIKMIIKEYPIHKVKLEDWIPHEKLPHYLNELKLIVIPSYSETGPFVAIEAMACGTPILATKVGLIPLLAKDGETGFILEDNSPQCIAKGVLRILKYDNDYLQEVSKRAKNKINENYTFSSTINGWKENLEKINIK